MLLELFYQAGSPGVANAQAALQQAGASLFAFDHHTQSVLIHIVGAIAAAAVKVHHHAALAVQLDGLGYDFVVILRGGLCP